MTLSSTQTSLSELQLFKYIDDGNGSFLLPGELSTESVESTYYKYYSKSDEAKTAAEIKYLYNSTIEWTDVTPYYGTGVNPNQYEMYRTIEMKQSNRFNLLQTVAEKFKLWINFKYENDSNGKVTGRKISLSTEKGEQQGLAFTYGLDLKQIQRTQVSDNLVTKTIVAANSNEFGVDGMCDIGRAKSNRLGTNYILDFGYYEEQGLIDSTELFNDLYTTFDGEGKPGFVT